MEDTFRIKFFPTKGVTIIKKKFATVEDLFLIPNKNLLQLNSDRLPCGAFLFWEKKDPTTGHKRVFKDFDRRVQSVNGGP